MTRRMRLGKPIEPAEIPGFPVGRGRSADLRRVVPRVGQEFEDASVKGVNSIGPSQLPLLHEAVLSWMAPNGFVLSGL